MGVKSTKSETSLSKLYWYLSSLIDSAWLIISSSASVASSENGLFPDFSVRLSRRVEKSLRSASGASSSPKGLTPWTKLYYKSLTFKIMADIGSKPLQFSKLYKKRVNHKADIFYIFGNFETYACKDKTLGSNWRGLYLKALHMNHTI